MMHSDCPSPKHTQPSLIQFSLFVHLIDLDALTRGPFSFTQTVILEPPPPLLASRAGSLGLSIDEVTQSRALIQPRFAFSSTLR